LYARAVQALLDVVTIPMGGEHFRRRPILHVQALGYPSNATNALPPASSNVSRLENPGRSPSDSGSTASA
jgi:hypothetical protein